MLLFYFLLDYLSHKFNIVCWIIGIKRNSKIHLILAALSLPIVIAIIVAISIVSLLLYVLLIFCSWIAFGVLGYFGVSASLELEGIRLSNYAKTTSRLLFWKDINEVNQVFKAPCFTLEFLLKSGELVTIDFGTFENLELDLKKHNIPFRKLK